MIRTPGVEMLLGMVHDDQFGPVVLVGFGGVHVEALADVVYALPPFDAAEAHRLVERLKLGALLHSPRYKSPASRGRILQDGGAVFRGGRRSRRSSRVRSI